jgi:N,N-dimethylformamidase
MISSPGRLDQVPQSGPLRIAAVRNGPGAANAMLEKPDHGFCGRIQDVRIVNQALSAEQIDALSAEKVPASLAGAVVCDFDFGKEINTTRAVDVSRNRLEGQVVNLPERGVRGRFWDGTSIKWLDRPDHYDAITFYPDDLYDAQWKSDFAYEVPEDLPSGIYCARLRQKGFTEYITFFVAAPKNKPRARLALWISDYSYVAYSNITVLALASKNYPGHNINDADTEFFKKHLNYGTGCVYNAHIDGRNFIYGS